MMGGPRGEMQAAGYKSMNITRTVDNYRNYPNLFMEQKNASILPAQGQKKVEAQPNPASLKAEPVFIKSSIL